MIFDLSNTLVPDTCKTPNRKVKDLFENLKEDEINEVSKDLNIYFNLESLLKKEYIDYSLEDKYLMLIIKALLRNPSIIALDNILIYLNMRKKILLLNYLNSKGIMLINVTSNMEDVIYTDYMLVLYNGMSAIDGPVISVLENEKVIKRLGFSLPFMVDLSIQLELYGLIDKIYLNKEMLVNDLWK